MWLRTSAVAALVLSCGYTSIRGPVFGAERVAVLPFAENQPIGVGADLAEQLGKLLAADGVRLSSSETRADAILRGTVVRTYARASPTARGGAIAAFSLHLSVRAELLGKNGEILWADTVSEESNFLSSPDTAVDGTLQTEANRRRALYRLAGELAAQLHSNLRAASTTEDDG